MKKTASFAVDLKKSVKIPISFYHELCFSLFAENNSAFKGSISIRGCCAEINVGFGVNLILLNLKY